MNDSGFPALAVPGRIVENHPHISDPADPAVKRRHLPKLILGPDLIGMVVTLGAIHAQPHEHPNVLDHRILGEQYLAGALEVMPGRAVHALGRDTLTRHLIIGLVLGNALSDPLPISRCVRPHHAEEVGELKSPVVDVFRGSQQNLNELFPLSRLFACQEFTHALRRRQGACQVQTYPPQEFRITRKFGRDDVKPAQFRKNGIIDQVSARYVGIVEDRPGNDAQARAHGMSRRPDDDGGLTPSDALRQTFGGDFHDLRIVRDVTHVLSNIFPPAVGQTRSHQQLLFPGEIHDRFLGKHFDEVDFPAPLPAFLSVKRPAADPVQDGLIIRRTDPEALPASVGDGRGGLEQQQALFRLLRIHPRILRLRGRHEAVVALPIDNPPLVVLWRAAVQREFEPSLPFHGAMAFAAVASTLGQDRADVARKTKRPFVLRSLNTNIRPSRPDLPVQPSTLPGRRLEPARERLPPPLPPPDRKWKSGSAKSHPARDRRRTFPAPEIVAGPELPRA